MEGAVVCHPNRYADTAIKDCIVDLLEAIRMQPRGDHYAELFLRAHNNIVLDGNQIKMFDGRWRGLSHMQFRETVSSWIRNFMACVVNLPRYAGDEALGVAFSHVQRCYVIQSLASRVRAALKPCEAFDANPSLLGAENAVIDMTGSQVRVRPACPGDLISRSLRYDVPLLDLYHGAEEIEEVMAKIYPVVEERRIVQAFAGYCLLGHTETELFLALTDLRDTPNGKSTVAELFRAALGEYATKGRPGFLLSTGRTRECDFTWGDYRDKRLACFEELGSRHRLDVQRIKTVTSSGGATVTVRSSRASEGERMRWTAKLLLVFNQGCLPRYALGDADFQRRMLVVRHRAAFVSAEDLKRTSEPHTFLADDGLRERLKREPWKILAWMLQGVELYNNGCLDQLPASIEGWRAELRTGAA